MIREKGVESEVHRIQAQEVAEATLHLPDPELQTGNTSVKRPRCIQNVSLFVMNFPSKSRFEKFLIVKLRSSFG